MDTNEIVYKGKKSNRSWSNLPHELVRSIATHYLLDSQTNSYCPNAWDLKELWHPRIVYTTFRDAIVLESLMQITPSWATALETHLFWNKACSVLDPHDVLAHYQYLRPHSNTPSPAHVHHPLRISPFRHFRQMTARSCYVCRINSPFSSAGLAAAKRTHVSPTLGSIALCREHRKTTFCGLCLREAPPAESDPQFDIHGNPVRFTPYHQPYGHPTQLTHYNPYSPQINPALMVCCAENEDEETWPGVDTTCRSCRSEWLWQRISTSMRDREAVGGPRFAQHASRKDQSTISRFPPSKYASADWETRQTVDAFIELGEGSIAEVIAVAREKFWLRSQTKMPELMEQAVAATRWAGEGMGVDFTPHQPEQQQQQRPPVGQSQRAPYSPSRSTSPSPPTPRSRSPSPRSIYSSEAYSEEEEEEEDPELLSLTEDASGVREIAIADWARARILDGHWLSPADQWYGYAWPAGGGVRDTGEDTESEDESDDGHGHVSKRRMVRVEAVHPCPWTVSASESSTSPTSTTSPTSPISPNSMSSEDVHPRPSTVRAHAPPSFALCEQAYHAYQKQLREILLPAMRNLIRKCVIECARGASTGGVTDPAVRVARMDPDEVLAELRSPGVWFDGVDWVAGGLRTPAHSHKGPSPHARRRDGEREEEEAGSTSERSEGSHTTTTSPVLSTTTLQTTPSPPPDKDGKDKVLPTAGAEESADKTKPLPSPLQPPTSMVKLSMPIPVSPVLVPPKLLHPIPYVPVTLAHMTQYSLQAFKNVWREACAPLFHCRCTICERAMVLANAAAGHTVPSQGHVNSSVPSRHDVHPRPNANPGANGQGNEKTEVRGKDEKGEGRTKGEVLLEEVDVKRHRLAQEEEEEEEEEYAEYEEYEEEEEDDGDVEEEEVEEEDPEHEQEDDDDSHIPVPLSHAVTPRKRSSDDLGGEGEGGLVGGGGGGAGVGRIGTPPKRAKMGVHVHAESPVQSNGVVHIPSHNHGHEHEKGMLTAGTPGTGTRQRKRSSEELEVGSGGGTPGDRDRDKERDRGGGGDGWVRMRAGDGVDDRDRGGSVMKRLRVDGPPRSRPREASQEVDVSPLRRRELKGVGDVRDRERTRECGGYVDVPLGPGALKAGLVNGGELDGLYVFDSEET